MLVRGIGPATIPDAGPTGRHERHDRTAPDDTYAQLFHPHDPRYLDCLVEVLLERLPIRDHAPLARDGRQRVAQHRALLRQRVFGQIFTQFAGRMAAFTCRRARRGSGPTLPRSRAPRNMACRPL